MATVGDRIRLLRLEKNLTQKQFGQIIGVVKSTISQYENNKSIPDDDIKKKIAAYFSVSMDYLIGLSDIRVSNTKEEKPVVNYDPEIEKLILEISHLSKESKQDLEKYMELLKIKDNYYGYNKK